MKFVSNGKIPSFVQYHGSVTHWKNSRKCIYNSLPFLAKIEHSGSKAPKACIHFYKNHDNEADYRFIIFFFFNAMQSSFFTMLCYDLKTCLP